MNSTANISNTRLMKPVCPSTWIELAAREPFRVFFPAATLAGIIGVALWPLNLLGVTSFYPGQIHARIMALGMLGGFILGFLGTAMPRMLSARPFRVFETTALLLLHLLMTGAFVLGSLRTGNGLFLGMLGLFSVFMASRVVERKDVPPPGFILVALSLICAAASAALGLREIGDEPPSVADKLAPLLSYQGFILLPILGIGPFILPRFFGQISPHDFPESRKPNRSWIVKAALALVTGGAIVWSFYLEARGFFRAAYGLRFFASTAYMLLEFPFKSAPGAMNVFGAAIRLSMLGIVAGFLAIAFFPAYRVGLLHLTLVGGFAVITFTVATRVLFGHSGNLLLLQKRARWFGVAIATMLLAMATRISGDFWPKITASHYIYGAIFWIASALLWAIFALPKALQFDDEK